MGRGRFDLRNRHRRKPPARPFPVSAAGSIAARSLDPAFLYSDPVRTDRHLVGIFRLQPVAGGNRGATEFDMAACCGARLRFRSWRRPRSRLLDQGDGVWGPDRVGGGVRRCGAERARPDPLRAAEFVQPGRTALEMAAMAMLVQLASPMTDLAHMGPVILPGLCLARLAFLPGEWRSRASLAVALLIAVIFNKDLVGWRPTISRYGAASEPGRRRRCGPAAARQMTASPRPSPSRGASRDELSTGRSSRPLDFLAAP